VDAIIPTATPATGNVRFYIAGAVGFILGLGLMVAAVVRTRNQPPLAPPSPWGSNFLIFAGQVVASAGGFVAVIPVMRRRACAARLKAGQCPACGYDLRATPDRCPECGWERTWGAGEAE
jgi:hypothetical protein